MNPAILEIDGWMVWTELDWLQQKAISIPAGSLIVEIGAWMGRSSAALYLGAGNNDSKAIVTIDTWQGQPDLRDTDHIEAKKCDLFAVYMDNMRRLGVTVRPYKPGQLGAQYIIGDSVESASLFEDQSIDWWFDDGDHTILGKDIDAYMPKMKPDGVVSGHDYFSFFETIQQEIHKRFWVNGIVENLWWKYLGEHAPEWL